MCEKMKMHVTGLNHKGPSHNTHQHVDTELIHKTEGEIEMTIEGKILTL